MNRHREKICVVGLGYIGLPTAALLANRGYDIHGVDINQHAVDTINRGEIHIVEPELDTFVHAAVASGKLKADTKPAEADIFILAVPTPFHHTTDALAVPAPNIDYVLAATRSIAPFVREGNIVILESTSPVGTTERVAEALAQEGVDLSMIHVAHCPERVLPGHIMRELVENDRIIGGTTPEATAVTAAFYRTFIEGEVLETDAKTAEMAKLTENSFRDVNIAFANELSLICDKLGMDVWELIRLSNRHPRVNILQPGCGVGGHCIAVDPWFIVDSAPEQARLIRTAREVNDGKPHYVVEQVKKAVAHISKPTIACLGLAFKPDIDDLRESPALEITKMLSDVEGYEILAVEPNVESLPKVLENKKNVKLVDLEQALSNADVLVVLVKHREFIGINPSKIIDFVNI